MMTLDEAIIHAEKKAQSETEYAEAVASRWGDAVKGCIKHRECAEEHKQLAEWLKELREYRNINE